MRKPQPGKLVYHVEHFGERAAGILPFTDKVTITFDDTDQDILKQNEAEEFFRESLAEYFDGAVVMSEAEVAKRIEEEARWLKSMEHPED